MTDRHTVDTINDDQLSQLYDDLDRAEAAIERARTLADRWDNALAPDKPYARALRAALDNEDHAVAQPERWLRILFTSPDETTANTSALAIRDHLTAEFPGVGMRITTNAVEAKPILRGPCPRCESSPTLIPRQLMAEHVATVHPEDGPRRWLLQGTRDLSIPNVPRFTYRPVTPEMEREATARAEQAAADSERSAAWFAATGGVLGIPADGTEESSRTTPDNSSTSEDVADNPAATEAADIETTARVFAALHRSAEDTVTRVIDLYERWVEAGPPPLGVPTARWWDRRLVELRAAINPTGEG